jgi:uncharacterized phage-associated protein
MPVSAHAVANAFIGLAKLEGAPLTNMQLQKLVFLAQGYSLALLDREIYYNNTHAWQWGPVVPRLYKALQRYGSGQVTDYIPADDDLDRDSEEYEIVKAVWKAYKRYSGGQLSELTHRPGTPWSKTWASTQFGVIPPEEIKKHYAARIAARQ